MLQSDEIIAVSGATRSGSSLMMRLLAAAGVPTIHELDHSMEHSGMVRLATGDAAWLAGAEGHAVKLLDITHYPPPAGRKYRVIWMNRDPHEQAKSQLKFMNYLQPGIADIRRETVRALAGSIKHDRHIEQRLWANKFKAKLLEINFEDLLLRRIGACTAVTDFIGLHPSAIEKMLPLIVNRQATNYPGMLEFALMGKDPNA